MAGNLLFSTLLAGVLLGFGPAILLLWLGPENAPLTAEILPWLAVAYWVLALNVVPYYLLLGLGRVRVVSIVVVVAGIIGIILTYFAIARLGTVGAAVGRIAYAVLALSLFIPLVRYLQWGRAHTELRLAQADNER
jgi:O-antigen/teichoic acid export membrane protein